MTTQVLAYCIEIRKSRSFTKAAEKFHVTQQAMSNQVKNLEYELGFPLFVRNNKTVLTTEAGEVFLSEARAILDHLDSVVEEGKALSEGKKGCIRIAYNGPSSKRYLSAIVKEFYRAYPEMDVFLKLVPQKDLFHEIGLGVYDIITAGDFIDMDPGEFQTMQWDGGDMVAVVGKAHPLSGCEMIEPSQLWNDEFYTLSLNSDIVMRKVCLDRCRALLGYVPRKIRYIEDTDSIDIMLSGGRGFTLLNGHLGGYYKPAVLSFVKINGPSVRQHVRFVWRKDNQNPALAMFLEVADKVRQRFQE